MLVALAALSFLFVVLFRGGGKTAAAAKSSPRASTSPTNTPSATPSTAAVACGATVPAVASTHKPQFSKPPAMSIDPSKTYTVTMQTSCGTFEIQLDPKSAPNTVNSLVFLVKKHFYDGLTFHRISRDFVIQGGDPKGDGTGGPGYTTVDAPGTGAQYPIGTIAMAKTGSDPNGTSGSQFFVVTSSSAQQALAPGGTGQYAIVGHVVSGLDVVQKIAALPIAGGANDGAPAQKVYIVKATVKEF